MTDTRAIAVGDLVMIVRGHECALRLKGGLPWRVRKINPKFGGGWHCQICNTRDLAKEDAWGATGCGPVKGVKGDPKGGIPLSWLKRIPPLDELESTEEWRYITNPKEIA